MKNTIEILLVLLLIMVSCEKTHRGYKYNQGNLPELATNLTDFNTVYDDYNSTAPSLGELIPFCFSTNRNSQGNEYDIIFMPMNVNFNKTSGVLKVSNEYDNWGVYRDDYEIIKSGLSKTETEGNEYGPNLIVEYKTVGIDFTLLYSTDIKGNAQINFVSNKNDEAFSEPQEVEFLNSDYDDMYPTFNNEKSKIYFCSNRTGESFDFYYVNVYSEVGIEQLLSDSSDYEVVIDSTLSSTWNDKCPFIFGDKMIFASNREGGFGGYDLYYSNLENGNWSEPINFGVKINTEFDEYRPILINEGVSLTQTMMVFSSNRPGGLGGFDLYFAGIE